jgi:predicted MPP superfamily phosphohydrolase
MEFKKQIVFTSIISGVLPSAYLVSRYSKSISPKVDPSNIKVIGFILSIASYLFTIFLTQKLLRPVFSDWNPLFAYGFALFLFIVIQSLASIVFIFSCKQIYGKAVFSSPVDMKSKIDKIYFTTAFLIGLLITACLFAFGPFIFIFTSIYFIPNIYLHNKIKQILRTKKQELFFTIAFTLLVLMFPAALFLSKHIEINLVRLITLTGYYYAPLLLYLVLFYITFDLIRFVLTKSKLPVTSNLQKRNYKTAIFLILLTLTALIEARGILNFNTPKVQEYQINIPQKSASIQQLKIAMAADFHFSEITSQKFVEQFVTEINELNVDVVFFAGDIFESNKANAKTDDIKNKLSGIKSKYGVYAVEGNHGYYRGTNTQKFFNKTNITLLKDTVITFANSFQVMGRMDRHNHNRSSIPELLSSARSDLPIITMDHQPYYDKKNLDRIDLYLSGHTHNGQLFPFNLIEKFIYEIPWGYKKINNTHCFVTCGAQGWGPQVRTASQSEIMVINVDFRDN